MMCPIHGFQGVAPGGTLTPITGPTDAKEKPVYVDFDINPTNLFFARLRQRRHRSAMSCDLYHAARWFVLIAVLSDLVCTNLGPRLPVSPSPHFTAGWSMGRRSCTELRPRTLAWCTRRKWSDTAAARPSTSGFPGMA